MRYQVKTIRRTRGAGRLSRGLLCGASFSALALFATSSVVHAQNADRYWDANGAMPASGGNGNWNTSGALWSQSNSDVLGPYQAWNNAALDNAIFGTAAGTTTNVGTVTLTNPITVHNLTFQRINGWVLNGGTLTLAGLDPTILTTNHATIDSIIAGNAGLTKQGGGQLTLGGVNTFSGGVTLGGGTLRMSEDTALGALSNNLSVIANSTLWIENGGTNRTIDISAGTTLTISGVGTGSALYTGGGNLILSPGGAITLSNNGSNYTGTTRFNGCNGVCTLYFTSIGNLGENSALGAPTTEANGTIHFQQSSQYSDRVIYIGAGNSSERNWTITTNNAARIANEGTGTLTITGNMAATGGGALQFEAMTADIALLGLLSGDDYIFDGTAGRTITLGDANSYAGLTTIRAVTTRAGVLADTGVVSSLGTGSAVSFMDGGWLSYTGGGSSSDRLWTGNGAAGITNDGTGALALSGDFSFDPVSPSPDSLTLGGSYTGASTFSGVISGNGNLIMDGAGTWLLSGANTRTGLIRVENGTLRAGSATAFSTTTGVTVNGGTLDLNGFDLITPSLSGSGGNVVLGVANLTVNEALDGSFSGSITGSGGLIKAGKGGLTLQGTQGYTGATSVNGGTLNLAFNDFGGPVTDIISSASTLNMAGGTLVVFGGAGEANAQTFNGLNVLAGNNRIGAQPSSTGSVTVNLGAINRTGGLIDFNLTTGSNFTTTNTSLGGWATVNGTDYAKVVGGEILAFTAADYTDQDDASLWASGQYISDNDGDADSYFGTVGSDVQLAGLQFTTPDPTTTVTIAPTATLGVDGTIIVSNQVGANNQTITGGSLTGPAGGGTLGVQQNGGGLFTIASTIVDNGADAIGFTKGGTGSLRLSGANSYTGVTTLSGGRLEVTSLADGGIASSIGQSTADSSNLVLESGTLAYAGVTDVVTNRGFTLVNGGVGAPGIEVGTGRTVEFSGLVTSSDDAGLTKTGAGMLVLSNGANDYAGVTTITGNNSTLSVNALADGGMASGIGAATADSANLVLSDGGRLRYTGGATDIDRGFTLASGAGRVDVALAATTLTVGGTVTGAGRLFKDGDGTLVLSGANTYTGDTVVAGGTLRAGSVSAFGPATNYMDVDSGATLELGGFDIGVGGLSGDGTVDLGANTLSSNGGTGTFTGRMTGTGGFTRAPGSYTQVLNGCNSDYTGATTIQGAALSIDCLRNGGEASSIGASGSAPSNLVLSSGYLVYTGASQTTDRGFVLQSGYGILQVNDSAATLTFTGVVEGAGTLVKRGGGTLVFSGENTHSGTTSIEAGIVRAGSSGAFDRAAVCCRSPTSPTRGSTSTTGMRRSAI